jgi:methionyl-tRNA formyltransferase
MAQEALEVLEAAPSLNLPAVVHHGMSRRGFRQLRAVDVSRPEKLIECKNVNDEDVFRRLADLEPDMIFNVNNFDLIKPRLLRLPKDGIINFHNGPVPTHRGVNIPSWVIINGELRHAVTWHLVDEGVDTGPVVSESWFDLSDSETAISLIFRCIDEGIRILPKILEDYAAGTLTVTPQEGEGRYYSRKDTPNGGRIDFTATCAEIDRLVRGLTFHPFPNNFVYPHFVTPAGPISVGKVSIVSIDEAGAASNPGEIQVLEEIRIIVRCKDGSVALEYLACDAGPIPDAMRLTSDFGLHPGICI